MLESEGQGSDKKLVLDESIRGDTPRRPGSAASADGPAPGSVAASIRAKPPRPRSPLHPNKVAPLDAASSDSLNLVNYAAPGVAGVAPAQQGDAEELKSYSALSTAGFFLKHSFRDIGRNKCNYGLSFCSILVVVWSSLIINTLIGHGPIVFLQLAEVQNGQYDGVLYHTRHEGGDSGAYLDYYKVMNATDNKYLFSPRKYLEGVAAGSDYGDLRERYDDEYMKDY